MDTLYKLNERSECMKRQIRKGCFETNSSSTHAICITKNDVDKTKLPNHIDFVHGEFGWEDATYTTLRSKASYLYQAICSLYDCQKDEKEKVINKLTGMLESYGISCNYEPDKDKDWGDGYIDHGYLTINFVEAVLNDSDKLFRYLFGDSIIITGNDNSYDYQDRMYIYEGEETTNWGTYPKYGNLKSEFDNYEIYKKGN